MNIFLKILVATGCWILVLDAFPAMAAPAVLYKAPDALVQLIETAYATNESLKQLEAEILALKEEVPAAKALDDPRLTLGISNLPTDSFEFNQEPMTQKQIILAQKFPWFGKLDLKGRKVVLSAFSKQQMLIARRLELKRSVSEAYFELLYVEAALTVNRELNQMINQILRVAETAYANGRGLQQDVFQAQVELGKLMDQKETLASRKRGLEDQINGLINHETFIEIALQGDLAMPKLHLTAAELTQAAFANNPALAALRADIDRAAVEIELAEKDYWPDMDVRLGYGQRDDDPAGRERADFVSGAVTFTVPLWFKNKQGRKLTAAHKRKTAAERAYAGYRSRIPYQVDAIVVEIQGISENYRLFQEALLLQTDQWARASLAAYEVGKVDFDTMINAHVRRLQFGLQAERYHYSIYKSLARLEELTALGVEQESAEGAEK